LAGVDPYSFYIKPRVERAFDRPHTTSTGKVALGGRDGLVEFLAFCADKRTAAYRRLRAELGGPDRGGTSGAGEAAKSVERGRWFLDAGFRVWGERELENARLRSVNSPAELLELGRLCDQYGMPWRSVRLYQKVKDSLNWKKRRELSAEFRYLMFPIPYPIQVLENSAHYDLPPHLVYAMIREESRFDLKAVSRVGALGLMQLMPATGEYVARELELPEWGDEYLFEPEINLAFGVWYASSLMEVSGHDLLRMLAAYNAGPGNAKRWFEKSTDAPSAVDIVDGIDFKETRSYVQRVVESANVYHSLYFASGVFDPGSGR
jgi:soluble lytic murein transglycosylase